MHSWRCRPARWVNDINLNARGFNSSLNRRVLVLLDGRDLAIALLGNQEWNGLSTPLEDMGRIEMVRGPGSALPALRWLSDWAEILGRGHGDLLTTLSLTPCPSPLAP